MCHTVPRLQSFFPKSQQSVAFSLFIFLYFFFYHKIKDHKTRQCTKANESGQEAQKEIMGLIDTGLPQSKKNKVNSNSKARIASKIQ